MQVSREAALEEIARCCMALSKWGEELESPDVENQGEVVKAYPGGVPDGLRVDELVGVDQKMLRAELLLISGRLEVLAQL